MLFSLVTVGALSLASQPAVSLIAPPATPLPAARTAKSQPTAGPKALKTGAVALPADLLTFLRHANAPSISIELPLPEGGTVPLHLEPISALSENATIVTASKVGGVVTETPMSIDAQTFALRVEGRSDSRGVLTVANGSVGGFIQLGERTLWLSSGPLARSLPAVVFDADQADPSFLPPGGEFCATELLGEPLGGAPVAPAGEGGIAGGSPNACREVDIAIDTDWEYTASVFGGNTNAAAAYALAITAAASEIYTNDLNVRLRVSYLRLWTGTDGSTDPWDQGSTTNQLFQYRDYWVANEGAIERDLGHFLSGRGLGGGVAWLPGLCGGDFSFGLSANLGGSFPYPLQDNNGANWDIMVYSHEIGHNFGAPHTHSYDPPLDGCGNGDCSLAATGTIMSYCHLCSGGLANIALHFHPANVASMTEFLDTNGCDFTGAAQPADAMDDYLTLVAGSTGIADILFNDLRVNCESIAITGFDATTAQGGAVTLNPAGPNGRATFSITLPGNAGGADSFTYTITDSAGSSDTGTVHLNVLPLLAATTVNGATPKIDVAYYALSAPQVLPDFTAIVPYLTSTATNLNFASTNGNFGVSGRADEVGAVFEGWLDVPASGVYTLFIESDDGSRLLIDGFEVVDNDGLHGMVEKSGSIGLQQGKHLLRVEFFENGGGAGIIARWQSANLAKQVIPAANLSHGGTVVTGPDIDGNGTVNAADLGILLGAWGTSNAAADLNHDGTVDAADLAILLGAWG